METAAISYRVADFLKKHPPFHAIDEADLVGLAARGRVKFHEASDFVLWQGEPHRAHIFVIQQGTVSLWDEAGGRTEPRSLRGPNVSGMEPPRGAHGRGLHVSAAGAPLFTRASAWIGHSRQHRLHRFARTVAEDPLQVPSQRHVLQPSTEAAFELLEISEPTHAGPRALVEHRCSAYRTPSPRTMSSIQITLEVTK